MSQIDINLCYLSNDGVQARELQIIITFAYLVGIQETWGLFHKNKFVYIEIQHGY